MISIMIFIAVIRISDHNSGANCPGSSGPLTYHLQKFYCLSRKPDRLLDITCLGFPYLPIFTQYAFDQKENSLYGEHQVVKKKLRSKTSLSQSDK